MILAILLAPLAARAVVLECQVPRVLDAPEGYLGKLRPSAVVEESTVGATLSRCSYSPSAGKITCDTYKADRIEHDERVRIKKYYVFSAQFDAQLFPDMSFIENNGRKGIAFGTCRAARP
jgi:hypothetical protein